MQRHHGTFLDEEENKAVVLVATDGHTVQVSIKMIVVEGSIRSLDA